MVDEKHQQWSSDKRYRQIAEVLGPVFRPTSSEEIAQKLSRSVSLVDVYLRSMSYSVENVHRPIYKSAYRLGAHDWAISSFGQALLGVPETARDDYIDWMLVHCDAMQESPDMQEKALEVFRWTRWRILHGTPVVHAVARELVSHPWIYAAPMRSKAYTVFDWAVRHLESAAEAAEIIQIAKEKTETDRKFNNWLSRIGISTASILMNAGSYEECHG